jgi:LysM repeat protein
MRTWTESACVVLAWSILSVILVAVGMKGSVHPAQANTRTAGSTTEVILTSTLSVAASPVTATSHTMKYVVRSGDTLSGIAAEFAVRGGWPTLYAANRRAIGPDPDIIHAGTVLVLPGRKAPVRYTVAAGDTLSGIAAEFAVRGGWPALYAANRRAIGSDPNVIDAGTVLTFPHPAAPAPLTPGRAHRRDHRPAPPPSPPAGPRHHPLPVTQGAPAAAGMPQWLKTMLLAAGLVVGAAFLAEPVLLVLRRRRRRASARAAAVPEQAREPVLVPSPRVGREPDPGRPAAEEAGIVLADYDRVVVTQSLTARSTCCGRRVRIPG